MTSFDPGGRTILLGRTLEEMYAWRATLPQLVARLQSLDVKFKTFRDAGLSDTLMKPNWNNIGPRLGFGWRRLDGPRAGAARRLSHLLFPHPAHHLDLLVQWQHAAPRSACRAAPARPATSRPASRIPGFKTGT